MRRALLVTAVALPVIVVAAVSAGSGKLVEIDNYNTTATASYVNAAQCAGTAPLRLEWNIVVTSGAFTTAGNYQIYASNAAPSTTAPNTNFCPEANDTTVSPNVFAGLVTSTPATNAVQQLDVTGAMIATVATKAGASCDAASEGKTVWVCSHWVDGSSTRSGYASGKFIIQVAAPNPPTGVSAGVGDTRLIVRWTPSTGGSATADHYYAEATPVGGTAISSSTTNGQEVTISGLTNGTAYDVVVYAVSVGGNRSAASAAATGTPQPVDDFWDTYQNQAGAREQGGCGTGGTGAFALLGAAALLVPLRRRK